MAKMRAKVENVRNVQKELEEKAPQLQAAFSVVVGRAALRISSRIVNTLNKGSRTGREYRKRGGVPHVASAPTEPPKSDTGFLASTVRPTAVKEEGAIVSSTVAIDAVYSEWLEDGTTLMLPRPFVRPSFELEKPAIEKDITDAVRLVLRGRK